MQTGQPTGRIGARAASVEGGVSTVTCFGGPRLMVRVAAVRPRAQAAIDDESRAPVEADHRPVG
jgi:hypothetical protein